MIELQNVHFRYSPGMPDVLRGITLTIPEGGLTAVMGSNGSGKSTFARCLNGLLLPTEGSVSVDGLATREAVSGQEVRRRVGLVFQDPNLQMTSVTIERELAFGLENIRVPPDEMHTRVEASLRAYCFEDRKHNSPSSLSAGERQKLALASIMVLSPLYLILDEATSLLSARTRKSMLNDVISSRQERSCGVILITQYPSEALLCDRLIVLDKGSVAFDNHPRKVFSHCEELVEMGVSVPLEERVKGAS